MLAPGPGSGGVTDQDRDELEATAPSAVPLGSAGSVEAAIGSRGAVARRGDLYRTAVGVLIMIIRTDGLPVL
jgi:hypothetical protein